jgi:hypothetical protein
MSSSSDDCLCNLNQSGGNRATKIRPTIQQKPTPLQWFYAISRTFVSTCCQSKSLTLYKDSSLQPAVVRGFFSKSTRLNRQMYFSSQKS